MPETTSTPRQNAANRRPAWVRLTAGHVWIWTVTGVFALVFACALTFVYVDPNDATSLSYHTLGRNAAVQPPFAVYQSGMDVLLGFLPAHEGLIRVGAMSITALGSCVMCILLLFIAFDQLGDVSRRERIAASLACLLALPEVFYLGLLYTPIVVGMCCVLAAHVLVRNRLFRERATQRGFARLWLLPVTALIVLGGMVRWDLLLYPGVIAADVLLHAGRLTPGGRSSRRQLIAAGAIGAGMLGALLLAAFITRQSALTQAWYWLDVLPRVPRAPDGVKKLALAYLSVATPAAIGLGIVGGIVAWLEHRRLFIFCCILAAAALLWPLWFSPKELLVFSPALISLLVLGVVRVLRISRPVTRNTAGVALGVVLVISWILGVQVRTGDQPWGPGFELRPFDRSPQPGGGMQLVPGEGSAFPTREGPRPIFGHAAVLLGGGWRRFVGGQAGERRGAIAAAVSMGIPLLRVEGLTSPEVAEAVGMGMVMTGVPHFRGSPAGGTREREFLTPDGRRLRIVEARFLENPLLAGELALLLGVPGESRAVVYGWPSTLRSLFLKFPDGLIPMGRCSGILNLASVRPGHP